MRLITGSLKTGNLWDGSSCFELIVSFGYVANVAGFLCNENLVGFGCITDLVGFGSNADFIRICVGTSRLASLSR